MKKMSLKWQISLVGAIPLFAFLIFALWSITKNYQDYADGEKVRERLQLVYASLDLVDSSQKWRGKSVGYLSGGIELSDQIAQYDKVKKQIIAVKKILPEGGFDKDYQENIMSNLEQYESIQNSIEGKKISVAEATRSITDKISNFLQIAIDTADNTNLSVGSELRSLSIIEAAKEDGGKLRANLTAILSLDKPISDEKVDLILNLKAGVDANLRSKGLILSEDSKKIVSEFYSSQEWTKTGEVFISILKKSQEGSYGRDPNKFFATISGALQKIYNLTQESRKSLNAHLEENVNNALVSLWSILICGSLFAIFLVVYSTINIRSITLRLQAIARMLEGNTSKLSQASLLIAESSGKLSEASVEQASSLQETVSSADEINAMVNKNAANAKSSKDMSDQSEKTTIKAQETVDQMLKAINNISESNEKVVAQMNDGNKKISDIVKVIREIGEKTDVINDIVFQTKLLSFNASVEAARAGEHGKGFAVVAEEVGNLASMSGKAANEISTMLNESIQKVEHIVSETKSRVQEMTAGSAQAISEGKEVAGDCINGLKEILSQVVSVNNIVSEISEASSEQAQGLEEITKAMAELDQVTQSNTNVAQQTSSFAENLKQQAIGLTNVVDDLMGLIHGQNKKEGKSLPPVVESKTQVLPLTAKVEKSHPPQPLHQKQKVAVGQSEVPDWSDPDFEEL